jgi:hypothetical protein
LTLRFTAKDESSRIEHPMHQKNIKVYRLKYRRSIAVLSGAEGMCLSRKKFGVGPPKSQVLVSLK